MSNPCENDFPKVIDNGILNTLIISQIQNEIEGEIVADEGINLENVKEIRIEYLNVLKIDHLWVLPNLKKLVLSNNYIEKIENLEKLIHLSELDLSFNRISVIENLSTLVNLQILTFFDNQIKVLENMDNLKKLTIFSIGRNVIEDTTNVYYLRRFDNLKSLNMANNPCALDENFRFYIAKFLPQLEYYEYRRIESLERELGGDMFSREYELMSNYEIVELVKRRKEEKAAADAELYSKAFVEYLNSSQFFESLFNNDPDGNAFLLLEDEVTECYCSFSENVLEECKNLFSWGQEQHELREKEINLFNDTINVAKKKIDDESAEAMLFYEEKKNELLAKVDELQDVLLSNPELTYKRQTSTTIEDLVSQFHKLIHKAWKILMKFEVNIVDQMGEVNEIFIHTLEDMINHFVEVSQGMFALMRDYESDYSRGVSEAVERFFFELTYSREAEPGGVEGQIPDGLKEILADKETYLNALSNSHEIHLQLIDGREDRLISRANNWLKDFATDLHQNELKRNRDKILEINQFHDSEKKEFGKVIKAIMTDDY